jgi:hypothetical protein
MLVIPATLAEVATPETMGRQVIVVTAERAATAEAEAQAGPFRAALAVTPAVVQVTLLSAAVEVPEGRAVVRAAALAETEGRVTSNSIYPEVAAVVAAVQV